MIPKLTKLNPTGSSFRYDPLSNDLVLTVGVQFYYNYELQRWEINQNPYEDAEPVPIGNVMVSADACQLSFDANYQGKDRKFEVTARYEPEKIMLRFFLQLHSGEKLALPEDVDDIQLIFEKGNMESIKIYKHSKELTLISSLNIVSEKRKFSLIKQKPWRKFELKAIKLIDGAIVSYSSDEEFVFHLNVQPFILKLIKELVEGTNG